MLNIYKMIYILTHILEHATILCSILAKLKGFVCHIGVPPAQSFGYLGGFNDHSCYHHCIYGA